jgi:fibronectin-binding autotransporter adhesin
MADLRDFTGKNRKNTGVAGERIAISSTAARVNEKGRLRYNESLELMEYYNGTTWISIDAPPSISGVSPTSIDESAATTTFTISGSNFSSSGLQAAMFNESGTEISFTTVTRVNDTTVTAVLTNSNLGAIDEPYDIKITNGSGLSNTFADSINVNEAPAWTTSAGSLGTLSDGNRAASALTSSTLVATDPEGGDVDYYISSGALPSGLSLDGETGIISGTAAAEASNTTYNFTVEAHDTASNVTSRSFSITVNAPVVTSFTSTGSFTFNVPSGLTSVNALVIAGGGGGGGNIGGAGGAGGMVEHSSYPVTPGGSVTGTVGAGGGGGQARNSPGSNGSNTTFGTITAIGGGWGGGGGSNPEGPVASHSGNPGGSGGGGGGYVSSQTQGTGTQGPSGGGTGYGNPGGIGNNDHAAGGGGGAGGSGQSSPSGTQAGNGGVGRQNDILGPNHYWAGGGGGSTYNGNPVSGNGGLGGGGGGGNNNANAGSGGGSALNSGQNGLNIPEGSTSISGGAGGTNTGGGGGGGSHDQNRGGTGGPGIVVVAY